MENYLINENTIAVQKRSKQTIIYDVENIRVINKNIRSILNLNCNFYGSSLLGRLKSASKILNIKYKIPIIINENNVILLPIKSLRHEDTLLLVSNKIIKYEEQDAKLKVYTINNQEFILNISKNSFEKMLLKNVKFSLKST